MPSIQKMIRGEIYDSLRNQLTKTDSKSKTPYYQKFIKTMLEQALKDPKCAFANILAQEICRKDILDKLDSETEKMLSRDYDFARYRLDATCYDEQKTVLRNKWDKYILLCTGRRVGKTNLLARWLVNKCIEPNSPTYYIHLKFENAIKQCYDLCIEAAKAIELNVMRESKNEGIIEFSNGSFIKFIGNPNKASADTLRGYKAKGIAIDEAAFQCNMQYLVEDICTPMMMDYKDSQMILASTPPRIPHTYYEKCYNSDGWKKYEWDASKNPFINDFKGYVKQVCKNKGLDETSAFIQREIYGKFYFDDEARVIRKPLLYNGGIDYVKSLITQGLFHPDYIYGGIDFGFADYNAIVTFAWDKQKEIGYVISDKKFNRATVTEIVEMAKQSLSESQDLLILAKVDPHNICYFGDTSDKSIIFELQSSYNFPIRSAYKHNKAEALTTLSELLRRKIWTPEKGFLADEFETTVYERDEEDNILPEIAESPHPDSLFAILYASRQLIFDYNPIGKEDAIDIDKNNGRYIEVTKERVPDDEKDFTE